MNKLLSVVLIFITCSLSGTEISNKQKFNALLRKSGFNGVVLVAVKGKVVFRGAYGVADVEGKRKLTLKSSFNLASVSKQFTATAVMLLVERGKIKLDANIGIYLPQLSYAREVTVRHLLNHTAGFPDIYRILRIRNSEKRTVGNEDLLNIFMEEKPALLFKPGERMNYSNTGYIILASLIEAVSGQSFEDFMGENIFKPLKMNDTFVYYKGMKRFPGKNRVWGLRKVDGKLRKDDLIYCDGMRGDGNIYSSVRDLFKWDRYLYTYSLLKKSSLKEMFTHGVLNSGKKISYGFGWGLSKDGKVVSHGGRWVGFRSFFIRYTDSEDTIIVLINCPSRTSGGITNALKKVFLNR